jgi:hypothetical protein
VKAFEDQRTNFKASKEVEYKELKVTERGSEAAKGPTGRWGQSGVGRSSALLVLNQSGFDGVFELSLPWLLTVRVLALPLLSPCLQRNMAESAADGDRFEITDAAGGVQGTINLVEQERAGLARTA